MVLIHCPAKVNLALSVGGPLLDDPHKRHPIASLMVSLAFGDTLTLTKADVTTFDIHFEDESAPNAQVDWPLEKDLAWRAHRLLEEATGQTLAIEAQFTKRIPTGAGLGGGSSNAANMIVGLCDLFDLKLSHDQLTDIAMQLGCDVAFMVHARPPTSHAIIEGLGEKVQPVRLPSVLHLVLILLPFGCHTGKVYQAFDQQPASAKSVNVAAVQALLLPGAITPDSPFNDLAEPACVVQPPLASVRQQLQKTLDMPVHITGSGSTLFVLTADLAASQTAAQTITQSSGLRAIATQTI